MQRESCHLSGQTCRDARKASCAGDPGIHAYLGGQLIKIGCIDTMLPGSVLICGTVEFPDNGYDLLFGKRLVPVQTAHYGSQSEASGLVHGRLFSGAACSAAYDLGRPQNRIQAFEYL
jgi:hypothetical protein